MFKGFAMQSVPGQEASGFWRRPLLKEHPWFVASGQTPSTQLEGVAGGDPSGRGGASKRLLKAQPLRSAQGSATALLQVFLLLGAVLPVVTALQERMDDLTPAVIYIGAEWKWEGKTTEDGSRS